MNPLCGMVGRIVHGVSSAARLMVIGAIGLVPLALTLSSATASAQNIYVDQPADYLVTANNVGGPGPDNGDIVTWRPASPFNVSMLTFGTDAFGTIQDAVDAASAGTNIHVAPGTFVERVSVKQSVSIIGAGKDQTFVDGDGGPGIDSRPVFRIGSPAFDLTVAISHVTIQNGSRCGETADGAGIRIRTANDGADDDFVELTLTDSVVRNNLGFCNEGSAIVVGRVNGPANLIMRRVTVQNNDGDSAIYSRAGSKVVIEQSTIDGNTGIDQGSIYSRGALTMTNSTISGNSGPGGSASGGGIRNEDRNRRDSGTLHLSFVTITDNMFSRGAGGLSTNNSQSDVRVKASIIAGNNANSRPDCGGTTSAITSLGFNIDGDNTCNFNQATDQHTDPSLLPLADNGSLVRTHAITMASAAYNRIAPADCTDTAGAAVTGDERSIQRPQFELCDVGAFELPEAFVPPAPALSRAMILLLILSIGAIGAFRLTRTT